MATRRAAKKKTARKPAMPAARKKKRSAPTTSTTATRKKKKKKKKKKKTAPATTRAAPNKTVARRVSAPRPAVAVRTLAKLPVVWRLQTAAQAVGLWVDEQVWAANDRGEVFVLDKDGTQSRAFKLPKATDCLIADEVWKYAGCNDGKVYDLTGRVPRSMYEIKGGKKLLWMEMHRGTLCVSDHEGGLTVIDVDGTVRWQKRDKQATEGWMVRADGTGIWHGSMAGLRKYTWDGALAWEVTELDDVRFGWPEGDELICISGYNKRGHTSLHRLGKDGDVRASWKVTTDVSNYRHSGAESCGGGVVDGALLMFVSAGDMLFCTDADAKPLWDAKTGFGSACTMQLDGHLLFMTTSNGSIACVDVSGAAVDAAAHGSIPQARVATMGKIAAAESGIERTTDSSKGVVVECVKDGGKLRVRVMSDGYHPDWFCQFPRDLREEGARYVVDEIREATQGGFYRVLGDIKRLQ